jgi:hypothetical protein
MQPQDIRPPDRPRQNPQPDGARPNRLDNTRPRFGLDKILLALIVLLLAVHALGTALDWYFTYPWLDIPMHLGGGLFAGLFFFYVFFERWQILPRNMGIVPTAILALGFVALTGTLWEFYQYLLPSGGEPAGTYADTLKDLLNDLVGGGVGVLARNASCVVDK